MPFQIGVDKKLPRKTLIPTKTTTININLTSTVTQINVSNLSGVK